MLLPLPDGLVILRGTIERQNGDHEEDADLLSHLSPDRWNDPLNIEVGWGGESPVWLRDRLRYFAP